MVKVPISRDGTLEASTSRTPLPIYHHQQHHSPYNSIPHSKSRSRIDIGVYYPIRSVSETSSNGSGDRQDGQHHHQQHPGFRIPRKFHSMTAGAGAGLVSSIVTCPLDVIKTTLQAQRHARGTAEYEGVVKVCQRIWRQAGFRGFYRGLGPTLAGYLPTWGIYFTVYDLVKDRLGDIARSSAHPETEIAIMHVVAAMTAGATGTCMTNPLWVVKTRFMAQAVLPPSAPRYKNTLDAVATIFRTEGFGAFYKGLLPSLIGVSHVAVQFPLYEKAKSWADRGGDHSTLPPSTILACSAFSKMVASLITYPHEVLRTRLQIRRSHTTPSQPSAPTSAPIASPSSTSGSPSASSTNSTTTKSTGSFPRHARPAFSPPVLASSSLPVPRPTFSPTDLYSPLITGSQPPLPAIETINAHNGPNGTLQPTGNGTAQRGFWSGKKGGVIDTFLKIKRQDGWRGFYRGLSINLVRTVPNSAVTMLTYELLMRRLSA